MSLPVDRPLLLVVAGAPASGKSTLAALLAREFAVPNLSKDLIKEALFDSLGAPDREASRQLSGAAYGVIYAVAQRVLDAGMGMVLESNFARGISEAPLRALCWRARAALVHCQTSREELARRYRVRAVTGERHPAHHDIIALPAVLAALDAGVYAPLDLDIPLLRVDTTNGYAPDFRTTTAFVRRLLVSRGGAGVHAPG